MITEKTDLVVKFAKSNGKNHNWRYKEVNTSLPVEEIKEACELLTTLDIFEQDDVKLFDSVVTAKLVTTTEIPIFNNTVDALPEAPETEQQSACFPLSVSKTALEIPVRIPESMPSQVAAPLEAPHHFSEMKQTNVLTNNLSMDSIDPIEAIGIEEPSVPSVSSDPRSTQHSETKTKKRKKRKGLLNRILSKEKQRKKKDAKNRPYDPNDDS